MYESVACLDAAVDGADAAVFPVDHREFMTLTPAGVTALLRPEAVVVDTRSLFAASSFAKVGYIGVGKPS